MLIRRSFICLMTTLPVLATPALAASPDIFAVGGLAIRGTDPVAYFAQQGPVAGDPAHSLMWRGATWRFASMANRDLFEADPMAYAPQYGGYCAYAASKGAIATSVPDAWTIYEGKLYLNFSQDVRDIWRRDIPGNILRADEYWPDILTG
uniref:YHS domain-containing (seleno)protein n=1 Tax=Yoonia sp. TaxID=2212373 RepID=UPI0040470B76